MVKPSKPPHSAPSPPFALLPLHTCPAKSASPKPSPRPRRPLSCADPHRNAADSDDCVSTKKCYAELKREEDCRQGESAEEKQPEACGRLRLQQHWLQVAGRVAVPETWGRENNLKDWVGFGMIEDALRPAGLMSARSAMVHDWRDSTELGKDVHSSASAPALVSKSADVRAS